MMKKLLIIIFIFLLPHAAAYNIEGGGVCNCNNCTDCTDALNDDDCGDTVKLTADVTNYTSTCIDDPVNFTNKIFDCQGHTIDGNDTDKGIYLEVKDNNIIRNCVITEFYYGIHLHTSDNADIINNSLINNSKRGIFLYKALNNTIFNNTLTGNDFGIYVQTNSHNNTLTDNIINGNDKMGIYLKESTDTDIINNTVNNNTQYGIFLIELSNTNITNNTVNNNQYGGIHIDNLATNNLLNSNTFCSNNQDGGSFYDIDNLNSSAGNSGSNNTADTTLNWNDTDFIGSAWLCNGSGGTPFFSNCNCSNCSECQTKLNNPSCSEVWLNTSIINQSGDCIILSSGGKTFDCQGNSIDGNGTGYGLDIENESSNTIKNCKIKDFEIGIYINQSFTFTNGIKQFDDSATQGITSDGTYIYTTNAGMANRPGEIYKYNKTGTQQTSLDESDLGDYYFEDFCVKDQKLYIPLTNYNNAPHKSIVRVYNTSDLSFIEQFNLSEAIWSASVSYHDGYFWITITENSTVYKYDTSFIKQGEYNLSFPQGVSYTGYSGCEWVGDYFFGNKHSGVSYQYCDRYKWNGSGFEEIARLTQVSGCTQGMSKDPDTNEMWWASRGNSNEVWKSDLGKSSNHNLTNNTIWNSTYGIYFQNTYNSTIENNNISDNSYGFYLGADSTDNKINTNIICSNTNYDINDSDSNSGDNNTCDTTDNWNDTGTTGCTYQCGCTCNSCDDCKIKLNNAFCNTVYLTADIINNSGTCIGTPTNFSGKTFDCQNHEINGNTSGYGIYITWAPMKSSNTVRNCKITNFSRAIYIKDENYHNFYNIYTEHNGYGMYLENGDNVDVINWTSIGDSFKSYGNSNDDFYGVGFNFTDARIGNFYNGWLYNSTFNYSKWDYTIIDLQSDAVIENCNFTGYDHAAAASSIILIYGHNNNITGIKTDQQHYSVGVQGTGNIIKDSTFTNAHRGVVMLDNSANTQVINNTFIGQDCGIHFRYNSSGHQIINNTIHRSSAYDGITTWNSNTNVTDVVIRGNTLYNLQYGIEIANTIDSNFTIEDNNITDSVTGIKINSNNHTINNNTVCSNTYGIYLKSSSNNNITNNTLNDNTRGIFLYSSSNNNNLTDNTVNNNTYGIHLHSSANYNTLTNNTVNNNVNYGILLYSSSNHNTLTNNTVNNNGDYGIHLDSSSNNILNTNELCSNSNTDLYTTGGSGNSGDNNTCDTTSSWNDTGWIKCKYRCDGEMRYHYVGACAGTNFACNSSQAQYRYYFNDKEKCCVDYFVPDQDEYRSSSGTMELNGTCGSNNEGLIMQGHDCSGFPLWLILVFMVFGFPVVLQEIHRRRRR